jgi:hypothetical protein
MSDQLVDKVRNEDFTIQIFSQTKDSQYIKLTTHIVKTVKELYRYIEPSHFTGEVVLFHKIDESIFFNDCDSIDFYDYAILDKDFKRIVFQLSQQDELPLYYDNIEDAQLEALINSENYVAYIFRGGKENFYVNGKKVKIRNEYSCPSIFALQYHYLNEELLKFKNEVVRKVSSQLFKECWSDQNYIYWINKPEDKIQIALADFLRNSLRGVNVVREYNLGASKPVDVRVFWREANRAALIEVKLMGRSMKKDSDEISAYEYTNERVNDGMKQIKEYIDLGDSDSPNVITKGYLVVVDGRRNNINKKVTTISKVDGNHYANVKLNVDSALQFYKNHNNIEKPIRMFSEPLCS